MKHSIYEELNNEIIHNRIRDGVIVPVPLCNFIAKITLEEMRDDGNEINRVFKIEGKVQDGVQLPSIHVPAKVFHGMTWVAEWGCRAILNAGSSNRDHVRA